VDLPARSTWAIPDQRGQERGHAADANLAEKSSRGGIALSNLRAGVRFGQARRDGCLPDSLCRLLVPGGQRSHRTAGRLLVMFLDYPLGGTHWQAANVA